MRFEPPHVGCYNCRSRAALVAILGAGLFSAGCGAKPDHAEDKSPVLPAAKVLVQTVGNQTQTNTEEIVGTVRAKIQATLEARLSGRIVRLPVVLGQQVKAGELVARLDAAEIAARLDQAESSREQAERDWKRIAALFEQQAATRAEYDAADARRRVAQGAEAEAKAMMGYVEVVAPFDGVVTKKWAEVGDLAAPGKPLISVEDPGAMQLEADVPEAIASQIHRDARLVARVDGVNGEVPGVVVEIAPGADPASRTFRVKLDLPRTAGLMSGQFARLQVPVGESLSLRVPVSAIVPRGQLEIVFVVVNGHAQLRLVKTGRRLGDTVEVLSGLDAGDSVVTDGADRLLDGQRVEVK